jgi:hypothetical protein
MFKLKIVAQIVRTLSAWQHSKLVLREDRIGLELDNVRDNAALLKILDEHALA